MFDSIRDWIYSIENDALRARVIEDLADLARTLRREEVAHQIAKRHEAKAAAR